MMRRTSPALRHVTWLCAVLAGASLWGSCGSSLHSPDLTVSGIQPQVVCGSQLTTAITVSGDGFTPLTINTLVNTPPNDVPQLQLPKVILNESTSYGGTQSSGDIIVPDDPVGGHVRWQNPQQMSFDIYPGLLGSDPKNGVSGKDLDYGLYDLSIQNPDMRRATLPTSLAIVAPPQVTKVAPAPACDAQGNTTVTLTGQHFLQFNSDLPSVNFTSIAGSSQPLTVPAMGVQNCQPLAAPAGIMLQDCTTLTVVINQSALPPDNYRVSVTNPDSANCTSLEDPNNPSADQLLIVPPPAVTQVAPDPACDAQGSASFTITGTGFLQINSDLPQVAFSSVTLSGMQMPLSVTASGLANCTAQPAPTGTTVQSCTTLSVSIPVNALPPDDYQVIITNPDGANCSSVENASDPSSDRLVLIDAPTVTSASTLSICSQADTTLKITGTNFLTLTNPAASPTLTINGMSFSAVIDPTSCVSASPANPQDSDNAEICSVLSVTIPKNTFAAGNNYAATLQNPGMDACDVAMTLQVTVVGPPTIDPAGPTQPNPRLICTGGGQVKVTGENISPNATILIGGFASTSDTVTSTGMTVNGQPQQLATASFSGPIPVTSIGMFDDVTIENAPGCAATLSAVETVTTGPSILFVDPPAIPNIITLQATVYASGISAPIKQIQVFPSGSNTPILTYTATSTPPLVLDMNFANRAYITISAGALAAGKYDLVLNDQTACPATLPNAITVVSTPTLTVSSITPAFGSTAQDTAVVIAGTGFTSVPRVYLSPSSGSGNAQALAAVTFSSSISLDAVVRSGLSPGQYDLVVVNPNGSFGIEKKAFTVTAANQPPPVITSIAPSSVIQATATGVVINGSGFRTGATLSVSCYTSANVAVSGGTGSVSSVGAAGTTINATLTAPMGSQYCVVRVTNQDGTYFDFSAVGVTNSSLNLTGFTAGSNLTTGRRALAAVAGRPTAVARFVYAFGGDNGQDNAPIATSEAAPTALNGNLGAFSLLKQIKTGGALPAHGNLVFPKPLSFFGATVIGRFVYTVGGFTGTAAAKDVYRAEILNPLNAPQFSDANFQTGTTGLSQGVYIYRVSAVFGATDANNPNGESLPSDFFPIQVPQLGQGYVQVQLFWPTVSGAISYNIYRSPAVNAPAGSELLLASVANNMSAMTQTYSDDGSTTPAGPAPLPIGTLGQWNAMPLLTTARAGAAVGAAQDPSNANQWYLYAAGGNSGTIAAPTPLTSVEFLSISISSSGNVQTQTVGATFTAATNKLLAARWAGPGLPATAANNSVITPASATFLFVGGGSTTSLTTLESTVDVAQGMTGGQLAAFADAGAKNLPRPGYGGVLVNNQMMCFGGFGGGGTPTTASVSATLSTPTKLTNFNSLGGGVLTQPRALQGTAVESAFIYQLGGANASVNSAQASTEQTIW